MIDNFETVENFMQFKEGTFYKFELLVRNTDGENILFPERVSNTNRNILIKSWYVDTKEYYEKIKHEMITLSNITGARIYVTLDRKENTKLVNSLLHSLADTLTAICNGQKPSIKNIVKVIASGTSKVENSCKDSKTIMFDVDTKDKDALRAINDYIIEHGQKPYVLNTKKGYHIFCYRKFDIRDWQQYCITYFLEDKEPEGRCLSSEEEEKYTKFFKEAVSVKENELGLVYHPMKMEETFYDKLYQLVESRLSGDFCGYNEEKQGFDIVQAVKEILENE